MMLSLIVAMNHNRVIGVKGELPWRLPNELKYFNQMTDGKTIIMGRKTFESLGCRPLKNRANVVVTSQPGYACTGCQKASSLQEALRLSRESDYHEQDEIFVIGGAGLYAETIPIANRLYITLVDNHLVGDVHFPCDLASLQDNGWKVDKKMFYNKDDRHASAYTCYQLVRSSIA